MKEYMPIRNRLASSKKLADGLLIYKNNPILILEFVIFTAVRNGAESTGNELWRFHFICIMAFTDAFMVIRSCFV